LSAKNANQSEKYGQKSTGRGEGTKTAPARRLEISLIHYPEGFHE